MSSYGLLDQSEEDALHASRLLNIEEKLYKRLSKRLLSAESLLPLPSEPTSNAADGGDTTGTIQIEQSLAKEEEARRAWRDDMLLDFAAFESNIVRVQFLLESNVRERERYAAEKFRIIDTAQTVTEGNTRLHEELAEAQKTLALKKTYDNLADAITSNRALRPRDEQQMQIERLNREIEELEREKADYADTWAERRDQFGKIVEEGKQMLRLIRDEKEEADRKEGMDEIEDGEASGGASGVATPRVSDGGATPLRAILDSHNSPRTEQNNQALVTGPTEAIDIKMSDVADSDAVGTVPEITIVEAMDDGELEEGEHE